MIADLRAARRLSLRQLSGLLPATARAKASYISAVECGRRNYLTPRCWSAMSAALGCDARDLLRAALRSGYIGFDPESIPDAAVEQMIEWSLKWPRRVREDDEDDGDGDVVDGDTDVPSAPPVPEIVL